MKQQEVMDEGVTTRASKTKCYLCHDTQGWALCTKRSHEQQLTLQVVTVTNTKVFFDNTSVIQYVNVTILITV